MDNKIIPMRSDAFENIRQWSLDLDVLILNIDTGRLFVSKNVSGTVKLVSVIELIEAAKTIKLFPKEAALWGQGKTVLGFLIGQTMKRVHSAGEPELNPEQLDSALVTLLGPWGGGSR